MTMHAGYDGVSGSFRTNPEQQFSVWWDKPTQVGSLRQECIRRAQQIRDQFPNKEIVVLYSGGLDSEWALESFRAANVEVTPLVVRYADGLNNHDLLWAEHYLNQHGLADRTLWDDLNLRSWYNSSEQLELAEAVQTPELAYTGQYRAILNHHNGSRIFITGYDEPQLIANDAESERQWNLEYSERHYSVHKFFQHYQVPGPQGGWIDSGVFASYVFCPAWQLMYANLCNPMIWKSEQTKIKTLARAFPAMVGRPKYTGFEHSLDIVVERARKWQDELMTRYGHKWLDTYKMELGDVWKSVGVGHVSTP